MSYPNDTVAMEYLRLHNIERDETKLRFKMNVSKDVGKTYYFVHTILEAGSMIIKLVIIKYHIMYVAWGNYGTLILRQAHVTHVTLNIIMTYSVSGRYQNSFFVFLT